MRRAWNSRQPAEPHYFRTHDRRAQSRRSEEHTSELQSQSNLVCRLLLEKKKPLLPVVPSGKEPLASPAYSPWGRSVSRGLPAGGSISPRKASETPPWRRSSLQVFSCSFP